MPVTGKGWELHVERLAIQTKGSRKRTLGRYQVYIEGVALPELKGFVCETQGPGDNSRTGKSKRRVEAGCYQLYTQFGRYRSIGYAGENHAAGKVPMPGFRLEDRGVRTDILVHPGHPPSLYLSSIGCLNLTEQVAPGEFMNFWDSRRRVIALLESLKAFSPKSFDDEVMTKIGGAFAVIDGEPMKEVRAVPLGATKGAAVEAAFAEAIPLSLPVSESAARKCATWLWQNFSAELKAAVQGKPYSVSHLAAIVCQETAYKWVPWIGKQTATTIVERAVYDASGDDPRSPRSAFPKNTSEFRRRFGDALTDMLIEEANKTRAIQAWGPKHWVYKGFGLFQYDLQNVLTDRAFFEQKQWYDFKICVQKCTMELDSKLARTHGDLWKAIRAYNGSGRKAQQYMENVRYFARICDEVVGEAQAETPAVLVGAMAAAKTLSGPEWVERFPDGAQIEDLEPAFRAACEAFIAALRKAGAAVEVHSTRRPRERAYLMSTAWRIAHEGVNPRAVKMCSGVDIDWVHCKADGSIDLEASRKAAAAMVEAYGIAFRPALRSNHTAGKAIDMTISWNGSLHASNAKSKTVTITSAPRSGMNPALWRVGSSYGVKKLPSDPPHWSATGH